MQLIQFYCIVADEFQWMDSVAETWSPEQSFLGGGVCGDPLLPPEEASQRRRSSNQMMIFLFIYDYIPDFFSYMKSLPC